MVWCGVVWYGLVWWQSMVQFAHLVGLEEIGPDICVRLQPAGDVASHGTSIPYHSMLSIPWCGYHTMLWLWPLCKCYTGSAILATLGVPG